MDYIYSVQNKNTLREGLGVSVDKRKIATRLRFGAVLLFCLLFKFF
jgi:hypothetical protein